MPRHSQIQFRRGTSTEWSTQNPVLSLGEPGFDTTNNVIKVGDGSTTWTNLSEIGAFAETYTGDLDGPIISECRNDTGSTITAGTPVYISGYYSSNGKPQIAPADASNSSKMPAVGLMATNLTTGNEGHFHAFGKITKINTASFGVGDIVYVASGGGLTNSRPTSASVLVQNIGRVLRSDSSQGRILILGPGRTNDVPNSGNFASLTVNNTDVSLDGHVHTTGDITGFASGVGDILQGDGGVDVAYSSGDNAVHINLATNDIVDGRLTLESGVAVSTTDQTSKTTLYYTPYNGNYISLYDGTDWKLYAFSELSLSLSGYAANTNFDIFAYNNAGVVTLESLSWTNDTTRATSLTTQDGVYVKSGATTRRYIGTIRTTGTTGQCEDSTDRRFVWNYYNQEIRIISGGVTGSHSYFLNNWRAYGSNTTLGQARVDFVIGLTSPVHASVNAQNKHGYTGISYDTTSDITTNAVVHDGTNTGTGIRATASDIYNLVAGYHYLQIVQNTVSGSTGSFYLMEHTSYLRG